MSIKQSKSWLSTLWSAKRQLLIVLATGLLFAIPLFAGAYWVSVATTVMLVSFFALGYNLMFGYTGMLSFGHAAFYGFSAYLVAIILAGPIDLPFQIGSFLPALAIAVLASTVLAAVFGAICVQRRGFAFAMLTLAMNMLLFEVAFEYRSITNGEEGIVLASPVVDLGIATFSARGNLYYMMLIILMASALVMWRIVNSTYGQMLIAIRENSERAEFVGVPVKLYRWTVFVISGFFISIAGGLAAVQFVVVSPDILFWETNAAPVLAVLIGGPTSFFGPVVGGIIYIGLEEFLSELIRNWRLAVGVILIPIVLYFPGGVLGTLKQRDKSLRQMAMELLKRVRS